MHSMTRGMLVGHRRLAGSNKSSHCDYRLIILCAVGTLLARGAGLALRPHRDRKCRSTDIIMLCSRTLTGTCIQEEPKHRKDLVRKERFGTQSRFGKRKSNLKEK